MDLIQLEECLEKNKALYYGREKINILNVYQTFNLIDVASENGLSVFTIDLFTLNDKPSTEVGFRYLLE